MGVRALWWGLAAAVFAAAAAGCDGGGVPVVVTSNGGHEDPGSTRETPPGTRDSVGGDCLQCDVTYDCQGGGVGTTGSITLSSANGTCTQALIDLVCSGSLFGSPACSGGAGGGFTCGDVKCFPQRQGQPGVGSSGVPGGGTQGGSASSSSSSGGTVVVDGG